MLEWFVLPGLILIVVLAIGTAKPKRGGRDGKDDEPERTLARDYRSASS